MAKKKLILNESVTRRFMKLATIKPTYVSNFLTEAEEDEEMMGDEEPAMDPEMEAEAEPELDAELEVEDELEAPAEAEGLVMDLLTHVQKFAEENGVSMELEGDEPEDDMEDMDDEGMEMDAEPEGGDMELPAGDEMPEDAEANYGGDEKTMQEEVDADLDAAGISVVDEDKIVAEVTKRVARRLLRESAKRK